MHAAALCSVTIHSKQAKMESNITELKEYCPNKYMYCEFSVMLHERFIIIEDFPEKIGHGNCTGKRLALVHYYSWYCRSNCGVV